MKLQEILSVKGSKVHSIAADASLQDVVQELTRQQVGSLIVFNSAGQPVGIVTERDILRACVAGSQPLAAVKVADAMSADLVTGTLDDDVQDVMGLMTIRRIRHLPILHEGKLVGIISIGDVVKAHHDHLILENKYLKDYITG